MSIPSSQSIENAVYCEYVEGSKTVCLFFGGMAGGMGIPPFEFMRVSRIAKHNKIFIRDLSQSWYQSPVSGFGRSLEDKVQFIQSKIKEIGIEKLIFIGNSMGGYAAIMFASILGVGEVHAFSPQTTIDIRERYHMGDSRWRRQVYKTYIRNMFSRNLYDLRECIHQQRKEDIHIHVSSSDHLDMLHASRLQKYSCVKIHEYQEGGHGLVAYLRDTGMLEKILLDV